MALGMMLGACTMEDPVKTGTGTGTGGSNGEPVEVVFNLRAPDPDVSLTRNISFQVPSENYLMEDLAIFVFKQGNGGYVFDYAVKTSETQSLGDNMAMFTAEMKSSDNPVKLMFIVDFDLNLVVPDLEIVPLEAGLTEEEVRELFVLERLRDDDYTTLYGEVVLPRLEKVMGNTIEITVTRSVARVDVDKNLEVGSRPFEVTSVRLYRPLDRYQIFPDADAINPSIPTRVRSVSIPQEAEIVDAVEWEFHFLGDDGTTLSYHTPMLVPESPEAVTDDEKLNATCVIVGGYYNGDTSKERFYRVDFNSGEPGHPFGQILRNTRYVFNITKVLAPGKDTVEEAATTTANSMVVKVTTWNDNVSQVNFVGTGDYIMVNTNDVVMPYNDGGQRTFTVRSTLPFEWQLGQDGTVYSSEDGVSVGDSHYSIWVTTSPQGEYTDYTFNIENEAENTDPNDARESAVFIMLQGATLSVSITQEATAGPRVINVLSLTNNYGSMGVWYPDDPGLVPAQGSYLRDMLVNPANFGPEGTVKIEGFTFDEFQVADVSATSLASADLLRRQLVAADILILPYYSNPSGAILATIEEWRQDPSHVVFVSADAPTTNTAFIGGLDDGLTWYDEGELSDEGLLTDLLSGLIDFLSGLLGTLLGGGSPDVEVNGLMAADQTTENAIFVNGPFGQANPATLMSSTVYDTYSQFAMPEEGSSVIPLAVFQTTITLHGLLGATYPQDPAKTDMMMMGVDPSERIVYMGESQFTGVNCTTQEVIRTLLLNTWGWAVNTVLAE